MAIIVQKDVFGPQGDPLDGMRSLLMLEILEKIPSKKNHYPSRREFGFMLGESLFGSFCPPEVLDSSRNLVEVPGINF